MLLEAQREKVRNELIEEMKKTSKAEIEVREKEKTIKMKDAYLQSRDNQIQQLNLQATDKDQEIKDS